MRRINLEFVEEIEAIHSSGTAMNAEDHWIRFTGLPACRLHQESVNVPTVRAFEWDTLDRRKFKLLPEIHIEMRQLTLILPVQVGGIKVVHLRRIIDSVCKTARLIVDINKAHGTFARSDLRRVTCFQVRTQ